jgi:hypothetical protein
MTNVKGLRRSGCRGRSWAERSTNFEEMGLVVGAVVAVELDGEATGGWGVEMDVAVDGDFGSGREDGTETEAAERRGRA